MRKDSRFFWNSIRASLGESGRVDLKDIVFRNEAAEALRDPKVFSEFYLDSWPTLIWKCGFDIAPETLHEKLVSRCHSTEMMVAEDPAEYGTGNSES